MQDVIIISSSKADMYIITQLICYVEWVFDVSNHAHRIQMKPTGM